MVYTLYLIAKNIVFMKLDYKELLPTDFSASARVWIYQCNRLFSLSEALQLENMLENFAAGWMSHSEKVTAYANLFFGQFIVLMADESNTGVSGCSTDGSVRFIKQIETQFNVELFNRQMLAFVVKEKVQLLPMSQLAYALENEYINADTLYFNNTVLTKAELENNWIIPVKQSWLGKKISTLL
jgi:hypothetical protein